MSWSGRQMTDTADGCQAVSGQHSRAEGQGRR
jgi:hypothetical protein